MENEKKKIEDFGNKIGGAKKDLTTKKKQNLTIEDTAYWNDMERKEFIKKKTVWVEPDYKQMVDEGVDKVCVYFIKLIRDKLPAKPTLSWNASNDIKEQEKYITFISDVRDMVLQVKNKEDIKNITNKIIDTYTEGRYSLNSYFTNKLYRVLRMSCNTVEHEMNDKQFLWEDKDKLLAAYNIGKVSDVAHSNDRNRLDVTEETETGTQRGKFYYSSENNNRFFSENDWEKGTYYIYDNKRQILDINFETKEDAEKYILQYGNIESSRKEAKRKKHFVPPLLKVIRREGSDYRQNTDADGQTMLNTFNFYGGEFGNWERQTERQMNLNFAYDAFKDLAYALDVDDKDVSLDGNLSLAFGARGSGNALAHYEKIANVINLTRMKGAGSLAHEFGHALDSFIARATGKTKAFATETSCDVTNNIMDIIKYKKDENGYPQHTDFYAEAMKMDGEYTGYWAKNVELFARAFACYVKDKLAEKGMVNDYLCGHCESAGTSGEERTKINEAFDEMFAMLKERDIFHAVNHEVVANAIKEEQIVEENKPVEPEETIDYSDCIDILKGRMSISGSLLNKMSKWDYTNDSRNEIYSEWVSDYSDKVSFIFNPNHIHYGNYERPYKNKAFWEYYLKHSDEILNKVFDYVYDVAIEEGNKTREVLSEEIMRGSGFQDGKFRINAYYSEPHKANELANFLKEEYGIGGRCSDGRYESHDSKGIAVTVQNRVYDFTWNEVAKAIKSAIDEKSYITQKDVADRVHNARFHLENFADSLTEQEIRKYTEILAEYGLGIANIYEQELAELVKEQIRENDGVFSEHYSVNNAPYSFHLPEGTMSITETATKYHVADYRYDVETGKFIVSGHTNSDVRKMIKDALETSLSEKATEKDLKDIPGLPTTDITTHSPVGNEIKHSTDREQNIAQKGNATMNTAIIGTVDYKNIKIKKYININSVEECQKLADELTAQGVPFSGRIQYNFQKGTITVSPENYKTTLDVLEKIRTHSPVEKKNTTIGNKPYKYIYDKKYINSNEEEIRKLADILTREGIEFSGNIYNADKAAITVSGAENQKLANAYLNYVRNTTVVNHIADYGFTLVDVQTLTVKDKNEFTMSFENYEQMESAFNDIENEFFHPTYYQLGLTSDAFNGVYAVFAMDSTTDEEKHIEKNTLGDFLTFDTVDDALSYIQKHNITIANASEELAEWKKIDTERHLEEMQKLIEQFGDEEHLIIHEDETISWTYFNPDGNNGNGQLVEMYLNINVVAGAYETYKATNDFNDFIDYINSNADTYLIDSDREDFESHAKQFIEEKNNNDVYILTTYSDELVERLTDNFTDIRLAKQAEKLDLDAISAETAYDMAVQASMNVYDKSGNIMSVESFAGAGAECYATVADVQKWGQIETIADFVDEINSYVSDNPSVTITKYQRAASEEGYTYAIGASEWENTARSISQGKYDWLKNWLNDVKRSTIFDDISILTENTMDILNDYETAYYASNVTEPENEKATEDIAKIITDKQNEMKEAMSAGNYARVAEIAQELNTLTSQNKAKENGDTQLKTAKEYIRSYLESEFLSENVSFDDLEHISAGYTELGENNEYGFQMEIDLVSFKISYMLNNETVKTEEYESLEQMNKLALSNLNFEEFVSVGTDAVEKYENKTFHLSVPELSIDVDMRAIDHIEIQYPDDKQLFYYSTNSNDIEEGWERNDFYDAAVTIPYIHGQLLTANAEGYEINIRELDRKTVPTQEEQSVYLTYAMYQLENNKSNHHKRFNDVQKIDIAKLVKISLAEEYYRHEYPPYVSFSSLNSVDAIIREQATADSTFEVTEVTRDDMLHEIDNWLEDMKKEHSYKSVVITDVNGKETELQDNSFEFYISENRIATKVPDVGDAEIEESTELVWKEIPESIDEETGKPTSWAAEINSGTYGRFIWISQNENNSYDVEYDTGERIIPVSSESVGFPSLSAAKEWTEEFYSLDKEAAADILAEKLTAHHPGKFMIEEYYNSKAPSVEELSKYIQSLVLSGRQGFGLDGYAADANSIILSDLSEYSWEQVGKAVMTALERGTYITPEERTERANSPKYSIYQVKRGEEYSRLSFNRWNELKKYNLSFDKNNYEEVYGGYVSDISRSQVKGVILDNIYTKFNIDRPEDFRGHSLSVGDVIVLEDNNVSSAFIMLEDNNVSSAFYVDSYGMVDVTDLFCDVEKQKIDISKLSEITLTEEYDRRGDKPDNPFHVKNIISFSNLNSDTVKRYKESTYEYDIMPDPDEGDTFSSRQAMLEEIREFFEDSRSDSSKSISITDLNGNTAVLEGRLYEFEATEDRLAFMIPNVGYAEMFERDDDGYDYTIYDENYNVMDSGVYDDTSISIRQAFTIILEDDDYDIDKCEQISFEKLQEMVETSNKSLTPSIKIDFTESRILYNFLQEHNNNISVALASAVLEYLDNKQFIESRDEQLPDVLGYDKTAITLNIPVNGSMVSFPERYDIGDGSDLNGKLSNFLDHIGMTSEASAVKSAETLTAEEKRIFDAFVAENPILTAPEFEEEIHSPVGNEPPKPTLASPSAIKSGDKFTMNGDIYTVVDKPGIYPDDVVIQKTEVSGSLSFNVTSNINRNKLFENYTYIGDGTEHRLEPDVAKKPESADTRDYRITSDNFNNGGGLKTRFRQNIEAIQTLKALENNGRAATAEEQAVLAKYVGWGGIQEAFDDTKTEWKNEYDELKSLLSEREYADAKSSVNNAHYTSPIVINAIYSALDNIGFKGGNILEPAMGTGNFFGTMPETMKDNSTLSGVELDEITGRIAQQLYQSANITVSGFERTNFKNNYFDVAIGNVPFGDYKVYDKEYNNLNFKIHDYFFAKSLDKVRPGGVVAFVTSQGTMDKKDETVRKYLAQRAELLGAIRLPNNAFKGIAGTEVTTDIIFLQKRDKPIEIDADWIGRDELNNGVMVNKYFAEHPEMILGEMVEGNKMFGSGTMCVPIAGKNLKEQLAEAVKNIKGEYKEQEKAVPVTEEATMYAPVDSKKFSFIVQDDKLYYRKGDNTMSPANVKTKDIPQIKALCEIRQKLNEVLQTQVDNYDGINSHEISAELNELNTLYDVYVAKYGRLSAKETSNVFGEDYSYQLVKALEVNDSNGKFDRKADIMQKAIIKAKQPIHHIDNASDALLVSLSEKFKVDIPFMSNITGMDESSLISELEGKIYQNPENGMNWETDNEYLSGNVREKLNAAKAAGLEKNIVALENVLPETVEAVDIKVRLGGSWIDPKYMKDFIVETFGINKWSKTYASLEVEYSAVSNDWKISGYKNSDLIYNVQATDVFGTKELNGFQILEKTLNLKTIEIKKDKLDEFGYPVNDINGNPIKVTDTKATEIAQAKQEMLQNKFKEWIFNDPDRRAYLVEKYNRLFNSTKLREYDGSHLNFVGMNENIKLNPHQVNAVARGLSGGNTLLAHEVGAGKTFEMVAIAMEGKRLGLHNKSMIAVPNHLTEQTGQAFRDLYPGCNILVATEKDFKPENRKAIMAKIATGDWDAVIVGHSQFDMCALSADKQREYINAEIDDLETALEAAKRDGQNSLSVKSIERSKKSLEEKLNKLNDKQRKDDFIEFEKLGIDKLFIDESQEYKNLSTATKMNNVSGVVSKGSAKALQLLMKCKYMDEKTGGNGIVFASGTPISNSMTEMYTLSRYLQADKLEKMGIDSFDKWASVFGETETSMEVKPTGDGQYQNKTRFAHFINLPELQTMFREVADVKLASSLNIERPEAKVHNVNVPASRYQRRYVKKLGNRAEACRIGAVDKHIDNMLKITTDGRKIGLDARCIDPNIPDDPASKVNICINNVFDIWKKTKEQKSTQLIFCDLATPQKPSKDDKYYIFRKQEDGSYANIFSGGIRTKDKSPERVLESLKKKLPKEFVEDEQCGVLEEGDIVVSETYDIEGGMIEHSGLLIGEGGKGTPITGVELNDIGMPAEVPYDQNKTFCVYDDIKAKLVKMGVPESEIAFIHDCKNNEEKQKLFDKMNKGEVRVMIGSTQKCGAGMNAQAKMIALHDLDAPYRPSDMGQRHGRIERRGNENKEVDIYRYMTEKTFDSYLYQLLENKQTFISQVMTEKLSLRVCEDIDESVLDFADAKALCSGNPLAKEKGELMKRISTLNNLKSDWNAARYKMQDAIKDAPRKISICEKALSLYEQDKATVMSVPKVTVGDKEGYPITINGKEYTDRAEGGKVLAHMIDSNMSGLHSGEVVEIGKYRGMTINAIATALWDSDSKEIKLEVVGAKRYYTTAVNMESNRYDGNLLRIDNVLDKFDNLIADVKNDITNIKKSIVDAEVSINAPFEYESELIEKTARLEAVNAELLAADNETNTCLAIYETLSFIVPEIENPEIINDNEFIRYFVSDKNKRPFVIEALGNGEFFASREDKKNGDVMTCGGITFKLNAEEKSIELTSYRDDYKGIYEEYSNENPASLNILKNCLEELNKIDDSNYAQVNSNAFHEKLDLSDDEQTYYAQSFDETIKTANKIEDALDSGLLDKNEQSRGRE